MVFATESFVDEDTTTETNKNELVSFMVPIAEKRLDFKYHKEIIVQVEELTIEIQDSILEFEAISPEP